MGALWESIRAGGAARGSGSQRDLAVQGAWRMLLGLAEALWISYSPDPVNLKIVAK